MYSRQDLRKLGLEQEAIIGPSQAMGPPPLPLTAHPPCHSNRAASPGWTHPTPPPPNTPQWDQTSAEYAQMQTVYGWNAGSAISRPGGAVESVTKVADVHWILNPWIREGLQGLDLKVAFVREVEDVRVALVAVDSVTKVRRVNKMTSCRVVESMDVDVTQIPLQAALKSNKLDSPKCNNPVSNKMEIQWKSKAMDSRPNHGFQGSTWIPWGQDLWHSLPMDSSATIV